MSLTTTETELLSLASVARSLGADARTVRGWGTLPVIELGNKFWVHREAYERFLQCVKNQRPEHSKLREFVFGDGAE